MPRARGSQRRHGTAAALAIGEIVTDDDLASAERMSENLAHEAVGLDGSEGAVEWLDHAELDSAACDELELAGERRNERGRPLGREHLRGVWVKREHGWPGPARARLFHADPKDLLMADVHP